MILPLESDFLESEKSPTDLKIENSELCKLWKCSRCANNDPCSYCKIAGDLRGMAAAMHFEKPEFLVTKFAK